jgi:hypothetical protein
VIARVLQTDLDEADDHIAGTNIGQSGAQASSDQYRRGGQQQQRHRPRQTQEQGGITSHAQTQSFQSGRKYNRKVINTNAGNNGQYFQKYYSRSAYDAEGTNNRAPQPRRRQRGDTQFQSMESYLNRGG